MTESDDAPEPDHAPEDGRPRRAPTVEALFADSPLSSEVQAYELWGRGDESALPGAEAAVVAKAVDGRRSQFAAGRQCARRAITRLVQLGRPDRTDPDRPILPDANRAPQWPTGVVGSISHTEGYALAVVAPGDVAAGSPTLGVDAERLGRVSDDLHERLFLPPERARLADLRGSDRDEIATLMFGVKESFYKAQYPVTGAWVGFHDIELRPDPSGGGRFTLHPAEPLAALESFDWPLLGRGLIRNGMAIAVVVAVRARPT